MAAPNIVNVATITGITTFLQPSTIAPTVILSNAAASNKVLKINNITAANESTSTSVNINVRLCNGASGAGSSVAIGATINIPVASSLVLVGKDNPFYLEEARSITVSCATTSGASFMVSYEDIS